VTLSLSEIRARRGALAERARAERDELGRLVASQRTWLSAADAGMATVKFLWREKHLLLVAAISFAIVQPRRSLRWALRALSLYRLVRKIRRLLPA